MTNPYQPTNLLTEQVTGVRDDERLVQPYRLDWLVVAAIIASAFSAIAIIIYSSRGGVSSDPILAMLVEHSLWWIPIYRLAIPLLLPMMPNAPRQGFACFLLSVGVLACVNDFGGILFGNYIVVEMDGFVPTLAVCIVLSFATYFIVAARSTNFSIVARNSASWMAVVVAIEGIFFAVEIAT